ncbi:hypothetical protein ATANTOWER_020985 [Ataeniobius toweri]|uniref:Uncharacterized protein n=1 Tax=Ataeniobius toweri TaxID=208326 RepID=A0ABU7AYX8_9TELE|nr:hypothetical protein [Ataeniobius toweri]
MTILSDVHEDLPSGLVTCTLLSLASSPLPCCCLLVLSCSSPLTLEHFVCFLAPEGSRCFYCKALSLTTLASHLPLCLSCVCVTNMIIKQASVVSMSSYRSCSGNKLVIIPPSRSG